MHPGINPDPGKPEPGTRSRGLLGVVHLPALPGSPGFEGHRSDLREWAYRDAQILIEQGLDGFVLENFGDVPFHRGPVEPAVVAEMAVIAAELRQRVGPGAWLGVNVLRNDAAAALAVASAAEADFIRVNVHQGVMFCDQGTIEGDAARTLRTRRALETSVEIWADVAVKHATPPPGFDLTTAAKDLVQRGSADALIVTGSGTGQPSDPSELRTVRAAVPDAALYVGSGVTPVTVAELLTIADGVIVGTALKEDGEVRNPVDPARVRALVEAAAA